MINLQEIFENNVLWQMSYAERMAALYIISKLESREVAVEVGSFKGGFLQILSRLFKKVYSLDIDHSNIIDKDQYTNVEWIEGDSRTTIPQLINQLNKHKEMVNLFMIDGDHEFDTAIQDINNILEYKPIGQATGILMHDSWYEPTRNAINKANWNNNPHVTMVEKDLVAGDIVLGPVGNIFVGGLALAIMTPEKRREPLVIKQSCDYMYRVCTELLGS